MKTVYHRPLTIGLLFLGLTAALNAQDWTRFRGPNGSGIGQGKSIPSSWTEADYNWKVALPGAGHSSPVLWQNRIFLLSGHESTGGITVLCVQRVDGQILWKKEFSFPAFPHHRYNSFASSTPAVDDRRVYVCWTTPQRLTLLALDHDGKPVWERDLGPFRSQHGGGSSPILYQDKVILGNEQDGESFVVAVDAATGQTRWQTKRRPVEAAYGTPCLYQPDQGKPQLVLSSEAHGICALNPDDGQPLWEYSKAFDKRTVSSPVVAGGLVLGTCGSGGGGNYVVAIRPPDSSSAEPALAYSIRRSAPYVPTSIAVGALLFLWSDAGIVTCLDAPTGRIHWQERVGGDFFSSPISVDDRLFCVSAKGEVVVVEAAKTFRVLARNPLGELTRATPAVAAGCLYVRTVSHLFSVGGSAKP